MTNSTSNFGNYAYENLVEDDIQVNGFQRNPKKTDETFGETLTENDSRSGHDSIIINISFLIVSFGYMLPWTSLGSLISYFEANYSADFYVKLNCAYYLPGLPVSLLQQRFDVILDDLFSSKKMYLLRGIFCFVSSQILLIALIWCNSPASLLVVFSLLGISGWLCHGTASSLASMFPPISIAFLQTGFRCPEIYAVVIVVALAIGSHPSTLRLHLFYIITSLIMTLGLASWIKIVTSQQALYYFELKDNRNESTKLYIEESSPLLQQPLLAHQQQGDIHINVYSSSENQNNTTVLPLKHSSGKTNSTAPLVTVESPPIFQESASDITMKQEVKRIIFPHCLALFITICASIFQAAFFAYVTSPRGRNISQILFFVRLFADLLGRPLTRLPRPPFFMEGWHLTVGAIARLSLLIVFFMYVKCTDIIRSDIFICSIVAIFSALSGYFTVLIYEYAARDVNSKAAQSYAAVVLNTYFQMAAFTAVTTSVFVTYTGLFKDP